MQRGLSQRRLVGEWELTSTAAAAKSTTKNDDGRLFVDDAGASRVRGGAARGDRALQWKTGSSIRWGFHRTKRGRPLKGFLSVVTGRGHR